MAEIVSSNGWSPLNNPILTKKQRNSSLEGVYWLQVFNAVLAYQKLYNTDEGVRILANTTENLINKSFTLSPLTHALTAGSTAVGLEGSSQLPSLRMLVLDQIAPFARRHGGLGEEAKETAAEEKALFLPVMRQDC